MPTTNVQPLQTWNELAWIKLGEMDLSHGKHRFETRHYKYKELDERGNERTTRILHMLDAVCITPMCFARTANGNRTPNIKLKKTRWPLRTSLKCPRPMIRPNESRRCWTVGGRQPREPDALLAPGHVGRHDASPSFGLL